MIATVGVIALTMDLEVNRETLGVMRDYLMQGVDDWELPPYIDIYTDDEPCAKFYDNLFYREWKGMSEGCLIDNLVLRKDDF